MSRIVRISASQNWLTGGGKLQFPLDFLPVGYRIDNMMLEATLQMDVPAAGLTGAQQEALVTAIECERRLRTSGLGAGVADWMVNGKDIVRPLALAVGNDQAVSLFWPVVLRDPRGIEPTDSCPATAYYKGKAIDVYIAKPTDILAALAIDSGSVQLVCHLSPLPDGVVPASVVQSYVEVIGKEVRLPAGRLVDLFIVKNDGATITEAELGNIQLTRDGVENLLEKARTPQLARSFNYFCAKGGAVQADGVEGEALPTEGALPFVPVWHPIAPFKATKLPDAEEQYVLTFDGTLAANTARAFFRIVEPMDEVATAKAAVKLGIPVTAATVAEAKTVSKQGVSETRPFRKVAGIMARRVKG